MRRITEIYAVINDDIEHGEEGVVGMSSATSAHWMPLVFSHEKNLPSTLLLAQKICNQTKKQMRLIKVSHVEVIKVIDPE